MSFVQPIETLINGFCRLPSVGRRPAERVVYHLLKSGKKDVAELTLALKNLIEKVKSCETCWDFSDTNPCRICANQDRDASLVCVVAETQDLRAIEKTGLYRGRYHILRGTINVEDENTLNSLKIKELLQRLSPGSVKEIILALNPDLRGETTMMFLEKKIRGISSELIISRLARGLPMGSDLKYADEITLGSALKHRNKI